MKRARLTWTMATGTCAALALALAPAARADVKAGVDAWSAGDYAKAIAEWRGPAAKGDADALFNLAQAYRLGRGVPEDVQQAEALYAKAAAGGHLKAADNYGLLKLLVWLEDTFGIRADDVDLDPDAFRSVAAIDRFVLASSASRV